MAAGSDRHNLITTLSRIIATMVFFILFRFTWRGKRNFPQKGPLLIVMNHQSFLDPVLAGIMAPRRLVYFARSTLFKNKLLSALIRFYGAMPVDRDGGGSFAGLKQAHKILSDGRALLMFPDATRTRDGDIGEFKPGFVWLAQQTGATILPVVVCGANRAWHRSRKLPSPRRVRCKILQPIPAKELTPAPGESDREAQKRLADEIRQTMVAEKQKMEGTKGGE
ncbi:MAG: lysophospholipid acyltransferase family protein [Planctomycetota bacterium]|nr:lysophospholipid acyltransferase family protein [Planctomycetota bacterium]